MPEISEQPITRPVLINSNPGSYLERFTTNPTETGITERGNIRERMKASVARFKHSNPTLSPEKVDLLSHLVFGPWMLDNSPIHDSEPSDVQKELSARIQHHLVHVIYHAGIEGADQRYVDNTYDLIATYERLAKLPFSHEAGVLSFLNGVKAELAIIRTLTSKGCSVYIPDYTKQSDPATGQYSEVYDWDIKFATDLIAVTPDGRIFLIDAKGQRHERDEKGHRTEVLRTAVTLDSAETLPKHSSIPDSHPMLKRAIASIRRGKKPPFKPIVKATITVPTDPSQMGELGGQSDSLDKREGIKRFSLLPKDHQDDIIRHLSKTIRYVH